MTLRFSLFEEFIYGFKEGGGIAPSPLRFQNIFSIALNRKNYPSAKQEKILSLKKCSPAARFFVPKSGFFCSDILNELID